MKKIILTTCLFGSLTFASDYCKISELSSVYDDTKDALHQMNRAHHAFEHYHNRTIDPDLNYEGFLLNQYELSAEHFKAVNQRYDDYKSAHPECHTQFKDFDLTGIMYSEQE